MKDTLKQIVVPTSTYAALLTSAQTVNTQVLQPLSHGLHTYVVEPASKLIPPQIYNKVAEVMSSSGESLEQMAQDPKLAIAGAIAGSLGGLYIANQYRNTAKKDARIAQVNPDKVRTRTDSVKRAVTYVALPLVAAGLFFSHESTQQAYEYASTLASQGVDVLAAYAQNIGQIPSQAKTALAVGAAATYMATYPTVAGFLARRRHGPIYKTVEIDGYMAPTKALSWANIKRSRRIGLLTTRAESGVDKDSRRVGVVRSYEYGQKKPHSEYWIVKNERDASVKSKDLGEPTSPQDVKAVVKYLATFANGKKVNLDADNVVSLAKESKLLRNLPQGVNRYDAEQILRSLTKEDLTNLAAFEETRADPIARQIRTLPKDTLPFRTNLETEQGSSGMKVQHAKMYVDDGMTLAHTRKINKSYPFDAKSSPFVVMPFRISQGQGNESHHDDGTLDVESTLEDILEGDEVPSTNYVVEEEKNGLRRLNLGPIYKFQLAGKVFELDMNWAKSCSTLSGNTALRRHYEIKDSDDATVARLYETSVLGKLIGNRDWRIDVFDKQLASDSSFEKVLVMMSQYLQHKGTFENEMVRRHDKFIVSKDLE
jgi:hypothetical protein